MTRSGKINTKLLTGLVLLGATAFLGWHFFSSNSNDNRLDAPLTVSATEGPFVYEVVERGEIESSSNIEIRCQVHSRSSSGTTILEIVPEGTYVEEGDFLIKLDDSTFQTELLQQEIICFNSESQLIDAEADVKDADLALREYEKGTYLESLEQLESSEFVAEENLRRTREYLQFSERLAVKGFVPSVQLEADRFAVKKAEKELQVAKTRLKVLKEFTREKMLNQLQANIKKSKARLKSRDNSHKLDLSRRQKIETQIENCVINAPAAGQVVYANDARNQSSNGDVLITEGRQVRERQILIRLPNPKKMQVVAKINESRIDSIKEGMRTSVRLDAFPDLELTGTVQKVGEYPIPQYNRYLQHIKEYATEIVIDHPPEGLRSGMTAQVAIQVEQLSKAVQLPPQSVFEHDDHFYCLIEKGEAGLEARHLEVGSSNEEFLVIENGIQAGEQVLLNPELFEEHVVFPVVDHLANIPAPETLSIPVSTKTPSLKNSGVTLVKRASDPTPSRQ